MLLLLLLLMLMLLLLLSKLLPGSKIMIKSKMGLAPLLNSMAVPRGGQSCTFFCHFTLLYRGKSED
jgi:hypothetical protein